MGIKLSEKFFDIARFVFFVIVVFLLNPAIYSNLTKYYIINETIHALIFYLCSLLLAGLYLRVLVEKYKDFVLYLINFDFLKSRRLRNELAVIKKAHSHISRKEIAELLHSHKAIKGFTHRVKFDYDSVCVQHTIRADKLFKGTKFRKNIAREIAEKTKDLNYDIIISSNTAANNMLSSTIAEATSKKHLYSYNISAQRGVHLISSPDLRSFKSITASEINILVIESTMITPKMIYALSHVVEALAEETDKIIRVAGIGIVFNGYSKTANRAFSDMNCDNVFDLFEVNINLLPSSDCSSCYLGGCYMENFIEKSYIIPYA